MRFNIYSLVLILAFPVVSFTHNYLSRVSEKRSQKNMIDSGFSKDTIIQIQKISSGIVN